MFPLVLSGLLAALAIVFIIRPMLGNGHASPREAPVDSRRDALLQEKEGVYLAIRELEFDHSTGVVSDEDHALLMARYRAHALSLLKAIDALGGGASVEDPSVAAASVPCPACGATNAPGHRFCTLCGKEMPEAGGEDPGADAREVPG